VSDDLTALRVEVASRCDEAWKEYEVYEKREALFGLTSQYRALGKARAFAEVLDLIDKARP
jgi:hypothetical protein